MTALTILNHAAKGLYSGLWPRVQRSLRDGCIGLTIFTGLSIFMVDRLPPMFLQLLGDTISADRSIEGADDVLRLLALGGFVITALGQAALVTLVSFVSRTTHSGWTTARALAGPDKGEAGNA